jgi:spermidine/putrescine transport system permease protein
MSASPASARPEGPSARPAGRGRPMRQGGPGRERAPRRPPRWLPWALLAPGLLLLVLLYALPLLALIPLSLSEQLDRYSLRTVFTGRIGTYTEVLALYGPVLARSLRYAVLSTALGLLIAYPLAWTIAFRGGRWKAALLALVVLPFFSSYLVRAIAWTTLLADQGPLLSLLHGLGLIAPLQSLGVLVDGRLLNTPAAVIGGLTYNSLPFLVLPLVVALERIDPLLLDAAADLYARPLRRFLSVEWPLARPGLVSGVLLSLIPAAGDVVNPRFLGGPNERMIANTIESLLLVQHRAPQAAALTLLLMLLISVTAVVLLRGRSLNTLPLP